MTRLTKAEKDAQFWAKIHRMSLAVDAAVPAMRAYARMNPVHHVGGIPQDPNGVHAWLRENDGPLT